MSFAGIERKAALTEQYDPSVAGPVFNIQRFSVHDGPGIRTVERPEDYLLCAKVCARQHSRLLDITGTPGGIAFAASRLGVPGGFAPGERTPDPQVRSQPEEPETPAESPDDPSPSPTEPE
jgi:hypothetical protein